MGVIVYLFAFLLPDLKAASLNVDEQVELSGKDG